MKTKPCDHCACECTLRYRIQHDATGEWHLVCPACQAALSADNPLYRYGGTWKAKPRKPR